MLIRSDPFRDLDRLTQQMFAAMSRPSAIPMDVYRLGDDYLVHLDLPGVDPASIDLSVERDVLTVAAERRSPVADGTPMHIAERPSGRLSRRLHLGDALDSDRIEARYDAGVLTLRIPVTPAARPRRIAVHAPNTLTARSTPRALEA
ncbi:18 kDa antigen 2 [Frankia canadensis]|uniref:18 kDa antigen 2 n=1 Tax=Frankia canadensis TaxID=1836972 RepID=A0A2I2KMC4_9ACTN|nr:Hsp20/alpha crystallin family protein [Frankia canadensis]SNQ46806.1 18 kDa antigen 2 [Frankia canadensis]SOU54096.1 18 kDa antigen 2 [Frankia canadensis]